MFDGQGDMLRGTLTGTLHLTYPDGSACEVEFYELLNSLIEVGPDSDYEDDEIDRLLCSSSIPEPNRNVKIVIKGRMNANLDRWATVKHKKVQDE